MPLRPLLLLPLCVAACALTDEAPTGDEAAAAEAFATTALLRQFPAYPAPEGAATCVVENATDREVLLLAGAVGVAQPDARQRLGVAIATRPETQACFASKNLPRLR